MCQAHGRRKRNVPLMTAVHRNKHVDWADMHEDSDGKDWEAVIYSDESKFNIFGSDRIQYCRRGSNEEFEPRNGRQRLKHGGGKVMM